MLTDKAPKNAAVMELAPSRHCLQETIETEHVPLREITEHA